MPSWRSSSEKRTEKSAARAKRHRESLGIPEWPLQGDGEADELASIETEELLMEIDRYLAGDEPIPYIGDAPGRQEEREEPIGEAPKPSEPSMAAAKASEHVTGAEEWKPLPSWTGEEKPFPQTREERVAPELSMAAVGAAVHSMGKKERENPTYLSEEEDDFVLQIDTQEAATLFL